MNKPITSVVSKITTLPSYQTTWKYQSFLSGSSRKISRWDARLSYDFNMTTSDSTVMTTDLKQFRRNSTNNSGQKIKKNELFRVELKMFNTTQEQKTSLRLTIFKESIKNAITSEGLFLPIYAVEKVFDFHSLSIIPKKKQQYLLNTKTIPILVRLLEIVEISLELLAKEQIITKRNLYYKLGKYYAGKYNLIDSDLDLLTFNTNLTKQKLKIFSSSRCLVFGQAILSHNNKPLCLSCNTITNIPLAENIGYAETNCKRLIIVEKQSAMYQIHQEMNQQILLGNTKIQQLLKESIFISSKGYPDTTSRRVVEVFLPIVDEIYYLGDSDIYGADIILCYSISVNQSTTFLSRVRWIQLQTLSQSLFLKPEVQLQSKQDKLKGIQMLQRLYLQDIDIFVPYTQEQTKFQKKMLIWKQRIKDLHMSQFKIELQAFFKELPQNWIELVFQEKHWS